MNRLDDFRRCPAGVGWTRCLVDLHPPPWSPRQNDAFALCYFTAIASILFGQALRESRCLPHCQSECRNKRGASFGGWVNHGRFCAIFHTLTRPSYGAESGPGFRRTQWAVLALLKRKASLRRPFLNHSFCPGPPACRLEARSSGAVGAVTTSGRDRGPRGRLPPQEGTYRGSP